MAEKGTLITDQSGGTSIATRDAYELDDDTNARVIQRADLSCLRAPVPLTLIRTSIPASTEVGDLTALPADLTANLITCGDKSRIVLIPEFSATGAHSVDVALLLFDNSVTPICYASLMDVDLDPGYICRETDTTKHLGQATVLNTMGAYKVGLLGNGLAAVATWKVWAYMI